MNRHGFTLVELIVAIAVFTLVATALVMTQVSSFRAERKANLINQATEEAEQFLARLKASPEELTELCAEAEEPLGCTASPCVSAGGTPTCGEGVTEPEFYRVTVTYELGEEEPLTLSTFIRLPAGEEEDE